MLHALVHWSFILVLMSILWMCVSQVLLKLVQHLLLLWPTNVKKQTTITAFFQ